LSVSQQEAELSHAMFRVIKNFAKSLKVV